MMILAVITFVLDVVAAVVALAGAYGTWRNEALWRTRRMALVEGLLVGSLVWLALRPFAGLFAGGF